jgi:signal-transduction protein with cAMP-binding, CBS, and nucleotidyltransferase domain
MMTLEDKPFPWERYGLNTFFMEKAMAEKTAEKILIEKGEKPLSVPAGTNINEASQKMVEEGKGAVLVERDGTYVGIWSERDLLRNILVEGFDPVTAKVEEYMSSPLITAPHTATVFQLIDKFLGLKIRHLVIEKGGEYIGLLYVNEVVRVGLTERTKEFHKLHDMVSWEYYEDWKWEKKRKQS